MAKEKLPPAVRSALEQAVEEHERCARHNVGLKPELDLKPAREIRAFLEQFRND